MDSVVYLDTASTSTVEQSVIDVMLPYFNDIYGNPSSNHVYGENAKNAIDLSRKHVSKTINSQLDEIYFTSGATESINWALKGFVTNNPGHIITVKTEHKAVLKTCEYLETYGIDITYLDVDENGLISIDQLLQEIKGDTCLIAIMHVNNEVGVIQDVNKIGSICKEKGITFFCDSSQAIGKVSVDVERDNIDMLCISAHKFNGPKGVGVLYKKNGIELSPLIHGGGQENGLRAGTYNTPLIVGLGEACRLVNENFNSIVEKLLSKRKYWEDYFQKHDLGVVNFKSVNRAPHIISITLKDIDADEFMMKYEKEFAISSGSACNSSLIEVSHVVKKIFPEEIQNTIVRVSV
jgi:cysteine desulfurase